MTIKSSLINYIVYYFIISYFPGSSKKLAKNAVATAALSKILSSKPGKTPQFTTLSFRPSKITSEEQEWADKVGMYVYIFNYLIRLFMYTKIK